LSLVSRGAPDELAWISDDLPSVEKMNRPEITNKIHDRTTTIPNPQIHLRGLSTLAGAGTWKRPCQSVIGCNDEQTQEEIPGWHRGTTCPKNEEAEKKKSYSPLED
jgi:hypothetical protein